MAMSAANHVSVSQAALLFRHSFQLITPAAAIKVHISCPMQRKVRTSEREPWSMRVLRGSWFLFKHTAKLAHTLSPAILAQGAMCI